MVDSYHQLTGQRNLIVVNLPPNNDGYLVEGDIDNVYHAAELLGICRDAGKFS